MANTMRWRYGDTNPVQLPVGAPDSVEIGDLVYLDSAAAKPASALADQGTPVANQSTFQDSFVGVAMQASPSGTASTIRIATTGVFEFECDATTLALGDLLGAAPDVSGGALLNQKLEPGVAASSALGRCARQAITASTKVLVDITSTVMRGGPQSRE